MVALLMLQLDVNQIKNVSKWVKIVQKLKLAQHQNSHSYVKLIKNVLQVLFNVSKKLQDVVVLIKFNAQINLAQVNLINVK